MSLNVETSGDAVIMQHYVAEVKEAALCRMVSISDATSKKGRTKVKVEWTLSARKHDDHRLKLVDEIYTEEELVSSFSIVVSASIPRMVKPQLRPQQDRAAEVLGCIERVLRILPGMPVRWPFFSLSMSERKPT